ncbi:hypothetical protein MTO96_040796 [Rhipicephalus appendiculatus]
MAREVILDGAASGGSQCGVEGSRGGQCFHSQVRSFGRSQRRLDRSDGRSRDLHRILGPPTLACGFFRVIDDSIFIATGRPPRLRSVTGDHNGGSPTSWSIRSSSSSNVALQLVRGFWVTLFIASMLFVAGVATTGLAYAKGVDFQFRRHGMLMILASASVVIVAAVFNIYRMISPVAATEAANTTTAAGGHSNHGSDDGSSGVSSSSSGNSVRSDCYGGSSEGSSNGSNRSGGRRNGGNGGSEGGGSGSSGVGPRPEPAHRRRVAFDESMPLVHSFGSRTFCRPCGLSVSAILLAFLWVATLLAVFLLRFLPASAKGSRSREWRDGAVTAMGLCMIFLTVVSALYVVYYCLCLRRRAEYVQPNDTSA